jgi:thioredoxin-dependent peroxiredoxin
MLEVGITAPDIDALATDGRRFRLSENSGRLCTVLFFFPAAFTPGCTRETARFTQSYAEFALAGAVVVGISTDDHDKQCKFAASMNAPFPMIGDSKGEITRDYDVRWPLIGRAQRVTYVLDPTRKILAVFRHEFAIDKIRDEVLMFVDELKRSKRPTSTEG